MVEKVVVYRADDGKTFDSKEEASAHDAQISLHGLVENAPFLSVTQGATWLIAHADAIVAALRPSVAKPARNPNAPRRGRRSKAEMEAAKAATQSVSDDIEQSIAA